MNNYSDYIQNIVTRFLDIKKNDVISISGIIHNGDNANEPLCEIPFIEELAVMIRKQKAFPFLEISTENLKERFFREMPEEVYSVTPHYYKNWIDTIDYFIEVGWENFSGSWKSLESDNLKKFQNSTLKLIKYMIEQHKKMIFLNFPDTELANFTGKQLSELENRYFGAINCDYKYLTKIGSDINENLLSFQNYLLFGDEYKLQVKTLRNAHKLHAGNIKEQSIISLPTGFLEMQLNRQELMGEFFGEKVYYKDRTFENIKLKFENGILRYIVFKNNDQQNFGLQNELMNSLSDCSLTLGFNDEILDFTNYYYYDRCIKNNLSLVFYDRNNEPIVISNKNLKIKKRH